MLITSLLRFAKVLAHVYSMKMNVTYFGLQGPRTRFLDTMSLHIATNGLTNQQRMLFMAKKKGSQRKEVQEAMSNPFTGESPMVSLELDFPFSKWREKRKKSCRKIV